MRTLASGMRDPSNSVLVSKNSLEISSQPRPGLSDPLVVQDDQGFDAGPKTSAEILGMG